MTTFPSQSGSRISSRFCKSGLHRRRRSRSRSRRVFPAANLVVMYSVGASDLLDYKNGEYVLVLIAVLTLYNSWRQQPYRPTAGSVLVNAVHGTSRYYAID